MDSAIASIYICSIYLAAFCTAKAEQEIVFKILENGLRIAPDGRVSIGRASDVFTDIQCLVVTGDDESGSDQPVKQWLVQPGDFPLPTPLCPNQTSFNEEEEGVLRVYSQFIRTHATDGVLTVQCSISSEKKADLHLELYSSLFFGGDLPSEIAPSEDLGSLCANSLPTLPDSTLSVESDTSNGGTTYSYCTVDTARGRFRSRSVVTGGTERFSVLRFERRFPPEMVAWVTTTTGDSAEAIRLPCQIGGATTQGRPLVFFLRDGERISPGGDNGGVSITQGSFAGFQVLMIEKRRGNEGLYQCVGQAGDDNSTSVVTSTYINLHYLEEPTISLSGDNSLWRPDTVVVLGQSHTPQELVLNCSVEAHPIPGFYWTRRDGNIQREVEGRGGRTGYRERAFSELRLPVSQLKAEVEFTCTVVVGDRMKNVSTSISAYSFVKFTEQPREVASSTREPLLSCSATSIPVAQISWFQVLKNRAVRQITSRDVGISIGEELEDDNCTVRSTLQLPPITDLSVTGYYCQGNNGFFVNNSNTLDLLQSVPAAPEVIVRVLSEKSVEVEWTPPTSLLPLDHYTVTLYQDPTDREQLKSPLQSTTQPSNEETRLVFEDLRPFTVYSVEVEVGNIAGNNISSGPVRLQTLEAAPEGAPENVVAEAKDTDKIRLSWSPPAPGLTNGVIRSYSIIYHPTADPTQLSILNNLPGTEADLDLPMGPGVSYRIRVAAFTIARGPFSEGVIQMTYPLPPSFSSGPPIIVPGVEETKNTIALQLPFVNTTQFSHFWVVVMRVDERVTPQTDVTQDVIVPPASPSTDPPANTPYIVAEMSADTYQKYRELFVIGDESETRELNDFPELYHNLPLLPGSRYTAFVRGFAPFIPPSRMNTRTRKQAEESERQYTVFSSSELLPITATLSAATKGEDGTSQLQVLNYVGIGVGCILVLLVVIIILVITRKLRALGRKDTKQGSERRLSSQRGQSSSNSGTLPRGLTVTGEGIKHEEHIYEDPLKSREAYSDAEPMYKVPRPISCEDMGGEPCNDAGYEIIPSTRPTPRNENVTSGNRENNQELGSELAPDSYYELMQHPSSPGKGSTLSLPTTSPTPYLKPVGVSDTLGIAAGHTLMQQQQGSIEHYANSPEDQVTLGYQNSAYANVEAETSFETTNTATNAGTHEPPGYIVMKSATLKHQ